MNQQKNQQSNQQKNQTKQNYQKILDRTIEELQQLQRVPTLLLHSCCAPCSSLLYWSICRSIFKLRFYTIIRIFIQMRSMKSEWQSKRSSSKDFRQKIKFHFIEGSI